MTALDQQQCEACRADAPTVSDDEKEALLKEIPDWEITAVEGVDQLRREFRFRNFAQAQAFTNKVADLAEEEGHHPAILLEFGKVTDPQDSWSAPQ